MKKRQMPAWAACLFLLALTVYLSRFMWLPITEDSGEREVQFTEEDWNTRRQIWKAYAAEQDAIYAKES